MIASPEAIPRKPLSARLRTKPFGPSFGMRHVSRRLSRKALSKTIYVPEALPRIPPEAFFETPSEPATCSRVPSQTPHLPDSSRVATCPRIPRTGRIYPGCRPSSPSVSECQAKTFLREPSEPPRVLRLPNTSRRKSPNALRPECRVNVPGCLRLRRVFRVADLPAAREPPRKTPSRALGECAACLIPGASFLLNLENSRKWF